MRETGLECVAHGSLGPKRVQKMLYEAKIFGDFFQKNRKIFFTFKSNKFSYNISKIVKTNVKLQKEIKASGFTVNYNVGTAKRNSSINDNVLDLSPTNCKKWQHRFKSLGYNTNKRNVDPPGAIVTKLIRIDNYKLVP